MKFLIFCLLSICICGAAAAQTLGIKGSVYRKISSERLALVRVTNLNSKAMAITDDVGSFNIQASVGDTLQFTKADYTAQKQMVTGYAMVIYLQPEIKLGEVTVKGQTKKEELNGIMRDYRKKGLYFDGKPPITTFLPIGGSPITGLRELFSKDAKNLRRFAAYQKRELEATDVDRRYTKAMVMRVTGLSDSSAVKFMQYYRPTFEDVKAWNDYDLINHVKTQYEYYRKNGDQADRLQKLY